VSISKCCGLPLGLVIRLAFLQILRLAVNFIDGFTRTTINPLLDLIQGEQEPHYIFLINSEVGEFLCFKLVIPAEAGIQKCFAEKAGCPPARE